MFVSTAVDVDAGILGDGRTLVRVDVLAATPLLPKPTVTSRSTAW
jgi:hypothetical protein